MLENLISFEFAHLACLLKTDHTYKSVKASSLKKVAPDSKLSTRQNLDGQPSKYLLTRLNDG